LILYSGSNFLKQERTSSKSLSLLTYPFLRSILYSCMERFDNLLSINVFSPKSLDWRIKSSALLLKLLVMYCDSTTFSNSTMLKASVESSLFNAIPLALSKILRLCLWRPLLNKIVAKSNCSLTCIFAFWWIGFSFRLTRICLYKWAFEFESCCFLMLVFNRICFSSNSSSLSNTENSAIKFFSEFPPSLPAYNLNCLFSDLVKDFTNKKRASVFSIDIVIKWC